MTKRLGLLLFALGLVSPTGADETVPSIHYIGFNHFIDGGDFDTTKVFSEYIETVVPIMARYGMTLDVYSVSHASGDGFPADAVTFGTAPDQESFVAFFSDPEFQAAFPDLVGIIEDHNVVFTSGPLAPRSPMDADSNTLLTAYWFREATAGHRARFDELQRSLKPAMDTHGVAIASEASGVQANEGLAGQVTPVAPPELLSLRVFKDAHAYFEDGIVAEVRPLIHETLRVEGGYWIEPWD